MPASQPVLDQLRRKLVGAQPQHADRAIVSSGFASLDTQLPQNGLPTGSLIEWVSDAPGIRTTSIALKCAASFLNRAGAVAIVDPHNDFNAAGLECFGIPLQRVMIVRPCPAAEWQLTQTERSDTLWAIEQLARCPGVRLLVTWIDRISATAQRRLQLAVEKSGVTVFLLRPATALRQTSWADLRFHVQSMDHVAMAEKLQQKAGQTRAAVRLIRSKNAVQHHGTALMDCHHEAGLVSEVPELARPAPAACSSAGTV